MFISRSAQDVIESNGNGNGNGNSYLDDAFKLRRPTNIPQARMGGRLPTRSEWERAARGTVYTILPWTEDTKAGLLANPMDKDHTLKCNVLYGMPKPLVSVFETSGGRTRWGSSFVADMIGNAAEWTGDLAKMEEAWVMGFGHTRPLVANIPSFARSVQMDAWFGFRCVTDFGNRL